jgi:hypothetical protein
MNSIKIHSVKNLRGGYFTPETIDKSFITQDGNLGVNVKDHHDRLSPLLDGQMYFNYQLNEYVYDGVKALFWNECQKIAHGWGYDYVESSGRSGGWACPMHLYSDGSSTKFYYVKCPDSNGQSNMTVSDSIVIERFNGFAGYVKKLLILVKSEITHITNIDEFFEFKKEMQGL